MEKAARLLTVLSRRRSHRAYVGAWLGGLAFFAGVLSFIATSVPETLRILGPASGLISFFVAVGVSVLTWTSRTPLPSQKPEDSETMRLLLRLGVRDAAYMHSPEAIISVTLQGIVTDCNLAFAEHLGGQREDLIGLPLMDLVHPDDRERTRDAFAITQKYMSRGRVPTGLHGGFQNRYQHPSNGTIGVFRWFPSPKDALHETSGELLAYAQRIQA